LENRLITPTKPVQVIAEDLKNIRKGIEEEGLYGKDLLDLIFGLLIIDSKERLKASDLRKGLEMKFGNILTEEYKARLGLLGGGKDERSSEEAKNNDGRINDLQEKLKQAMGKVLGEFGNEAKRCVEVLERFEERINDFRNKLDGVKADVKRMKTEKEEIERENLDFARAVESLTKDHKILLEELDQKMKRDQGIRRPNYNYGMIFEVWDNYYYNIPRSSNQEIELPRDEEEKEDKSEGNSGQEQEDERVPILFVDVNLGQGQTQRIVVCEGDSLEDLARKFLEEHELDTSMEKRLVELLASQIDKLLEPIEEEPSSAHSET